MSKYSIFNNKSIPSSLMSHIDKIMKAIDKSTKNLKPQSIKSPIAVIDTETGDRFEPNDTIVSFGISILSKDLDIIDAYYFTTNTETRFTMYQDELYMGPDSPVCPSQKQCGQIIDIILKHHKVHHLLAYNASFDKRVLNSIGFPQNYEWHDIQRPARNIKFNPNIPKNSPVFKTGSLKKHYSVNDMMAYIINLNERHNAVTDALDESLILIDLCKYSKLDTLLKMSKI